MKFIVSLLLIFSPLIHAQQTKCSMALDDVQLFCKSAQRACENIHDCMKRRDTCVEGVPGSKDQCQSLHSCMQEYKSEFDGDSKCEYTWATPSSGKSFCRVKKHFLFFSEPCPGRVHGLLNAAAYGLSSSVDGKYNCEAVLKTRNEKVKSCNNSLNKAKSICKNLPDHIAALSDVSCEYAKDFKKYGKGHFSQRTTESIRVNDSSRFNTTDKRGGKASTYDDKSKGRSR